MPFSPLRAFMQSRQIDAWLIHDFRGSNPILARALPHPENKRRFTTRRVALLVPAVGSPTLLVNPLDAGQFAPPHLDAKFDIERRKYISWKAFHAELASLLAGKSRVAMEYAPGCTLPVVSMVDAGTVELIRSLGAEVVSSADLIQVSMAKWSERAVAEHAVDSKRVNAIKDEAFELIRMALSRGTLIHEHDVQAFVQKRFTENGLEFPDGPIVAVNAHAGDPHYEPSSAKPTPIRRGDWVLIDMWARKARSVSADGTFDRDEELVYSDITWTGFCGKASECPARCREVFDAVRDARDAAVTLAKESWRAGTTIHGYQLDDAARNVLVSRGLENAVRHRTGHSLSPGPMVHGLGMNLDNLETRDTRAMLPGIGFTVEPGAYVPEETVRGPLGEIKGFGVRNEINIYVDPERGPVVTSESQNEPVWLG
jgi:Xaa-Pro aminopeptidase